MRIEPPNRNTYIALTFAIPCLVMLALWMQGDLTNLTAFLTLSVTAVLYLRMRWIQDFVRAWWRREYDQKVASTDAALARNDLTATERRRLQRYRDQLPDRYHLVTSPDETYKPINFLGYVLKFGAYAFKQ